MKKCLFISYRPIYPINGGDRIRIAQQLEFLVKRYEVDVVYLSEDKSNDDIHRYVPEVRNVFRYARSMYSSYIHALGFLFNNLPIQENYFYSLRIQQFVDKHISEYDFVFCANDRCSAYVHKHKDTIRYVDIIDANSMNYEKAKLKAKGIFKLIYKIEHKRCKYYEKWLYKNFNRAATISAIDYEYMTRNQKADNLYIVGNKADIPPVEETTKERLSNRIIFIGNMRYAPNVVAMNFFVKKVFPLIKKDNPDVEFYIVGAQPHDDVKALHNGKDIIITGFVDSVIPYMQEATIVVAPMLTGAGIQNKIITAMAYKCCVVTTNIGAEGLNIQNNEIAIVNDATEMSSLINSLLHDKGLREKMGEAARRYIIENLSTEIIEKEFFEFVIE